MPLRDLHLDGRGAAYDQIYRALRGEILRGRVPAGTRLPSTRWLAEDLSVSRNTVLSAYSQLLAEGYAISRQGAGTFVAPHLPAERLGAARASGSGPPSADRLAQSPVRAARPPPRLSRFGDFLARTRLREPYDRRAARGAVRFDFVPCVPDTSGLPSDVWRRQLSRRATHLPSEALGYGDPAGHPMLRRELAAYLGRARGVRCEPEQVIVVAGVAQALDLCTRILIDPGDTVLLEEPHYFGARRAFEAAGAELVAAPVDAEGIDVGRLNTSDRARIRLAYVTPSHQFPTGAVLSLPRRLELLRWASEHDAYLFEDDYDSEFRYGGRSIEALKSLDESSRVLYAGTFSKTLYPSLRLAYLVAPPELAGLLREARFLADWGAPVLAQDALAHFLAGGDFERHLRRARTLYGVRRNALCEALGRHLGERVRFLDSRAGLHLLIELIDFEPSALPDLVRRALEHEIALYPAAGCYLEPPARAELVMGFACLAPPEIERGVERLAGLLRSEA